MTENFSNTRNNTPRKTRAAVSELRVKKIKEMFEEGKSMAAISREVNLAIATVKIIRRKLSVEERASTIRTTKRFNARTLILKEKVSLILNENTCLNLSQIADRLQSEVVVKSLATVSRL